MFTTDVQFGHAGALAQSDQETSNAKNAGLKVAGAIVPATFEELPTLLESTYKKVRTGISTLSSSSCPRL